MTFTIWSAMSRLKKKCNCINNGTVQKDKTWLTNLIKKYVLIAGNNRFATLINTRGPDGEYRSIVRWTTNLQKAATLTNSKWLATMRKVSQHQEIGECRLREVEKRIVLLEEFEFQ